MRTSSEQGQTWKSARSPPGLHEDKSQWEGQILPFYNSNICAIKILNQTFQFSYRCLLQKSIFIACCLLPACRTVRRGWGLRVPKGKKKSHIFLSGREKNVWQYEWPLPRAGRLPFHSTLAWQNGGLSWETWNPCIVLSWLKTNVTPLVNSGRAGYLKAS